MTDTALDGAPTVDDRRTAILEAAIAMFRDVAFHEASPELLAERAGTTVAELEESIGPWDTLVLATIEHWNAQRMAPILPLAERYGAVRFLRGIVEANVEDPALMRLLTAMLNIAATPGHPLAPRLQDRWLTFQLMVQRQLSRDIEAGREPDTMVPAYGSEQLIALYEGLQLQSMVRPGMDLVEAFDRAITRMREGWSRAYIPPVWEIDLPL
ncbi:hypothetical protein [Curtobacterium sp. MCBD17_040]|uniref:TetR/AcrR family transcriptional regulator n=1 Tax=Curtobacterium sp. MCBD17_040 TaxID=2175674 RepID=UPI000DA6F05C|nr:hypothetical protein [Curtobacterium sp. MCBD17_040]WIB62399.1 hypothetical protein DEI94_09375 [Curtobacterium sp. MCBD17_040]